MKKLLLLFCFIIAGLGSRLQTIQLTNGGSTTLSGTTSANPISQYFEYMRFQVVYTAAELNAAGITGPKTITQLGWYVSTAPAAGLPSYKIRMANTAATNSATHDATALTDVYSVASYSPVAGGFDMLNLTGNFVWNGTSNLLVDVCFGAAVYASPYGEVRTYAATTTSGSRRIRCDACGSQCANNTTTTNTFKPQVSLTFTNPPSCLAPGAATITPTTTDAAISWAAVTGASGYEWAVTSSATPPASGTATSGTSVNATGLTSSTGYYVHVRTVCSGPSYSGWTTTPFTTLCGPTNIPYSQNFDGVTAPALPSCVIVQNVNGSNTWANLSTPTAVIIGTPNSMVYSYNTTTAADDWFFVQGLNLTGGTSYRLSFKWKSDPAFPESFEVKLGTAANAASMTTSTLYTNSNAANSTATQQDIDFTPASTGVYYIGFHCNSAADKDFLAIDDITVDLSPSCAAPGSLSAVVTGGGTSANLSWAAPGTGTPVGYEWATTTSATPPASGTAVSGTTANATGLTSGTQYYLHVRTNCGSGNFSSWATLAFSTLVNDEACGAFALILDGSQDCGNSAIATSVNDPTLIGSCSAPNNTLWYSYTPSSTGPVIIRTEIPSATSNPLNGWVGIFTATGTCPTPGLTLTALAGSSCLQFGQTGAGDIDSLLTPTLTAGTTYYFMIDGFSGDNGEFCIKLVSPPAPPTCTTNLLPTNGATGVSIASATLSWNAVTGATSYNVYLGTTNPPTTSIGTATTTTTTVSGLMYDSTYYWYVVPTGVGGAATGCSSSTTSFTIETAPANCVPLTGTAAGQNCSGGDVISLFRIKGESSELNINTGTACNSPSGYTDSTDHPVTINLARGKSYWGQIQCGYANDYITIWIDGNDDGIFDAGERLMNNLLIGTTLTNINLFIPLGTPLGVHRLRIRNVYYSTAPTKTTDPCNLYNYSDTRDFRVNITNSGAAYVVSNYASAGSCYTGGGKIMIESACNNNNNYVPLVDSSNAVIAQLYPQGNDLGIVTPSYFINTGALRQHVSGRYYLDRNLTITVTKQPTSPYNLRIFFLNTELNALIAQPTSGVTSIFDLMVTKNDDACLPAIASNAGTGHYPVGFGSISGDRFIDLSGLSGLSSFYLHGGSSALPITIEYFKGNRQGGTHQLDWKLNCTATQSVDLTIEYSTDGRNFRSLYTTHENAVRCQQPFSYTNVNPASGISYYRLKMVDEQGKISYSAVVALTNGAKAIEITGIAPNPNKGRFKLNIIAASSEKMEMMISDMQGRIVERKIVGLTAGNNSIDMDATKLAAGNYQIYGITSDGRTRHVLFVKQ